MSRIQSKQVYIPFGLQVDALNGQLTQLGARHKELEQKGADLASDKAKIICNLQDELKTITAQHGKYIATYKRGLTL